jgi:hypothetical protein
MDIRGGVKGKPGQQVSRWAAASFGRDGGTERWVVEWLKLQKCHVATIPSLAL